MNDLQPFKNELFEVAVKLEDDEVMFEASMTARSLGFTQTQTKKGKRYTSVRWERVNKYLSEVGFPHQVGEGDLIPESIVYLLAFKGETKLAIEFQKWLAIEVIPQIRKTGGYNQQPKPQVDKDKKLKIREMNARTRMANMYLKLSNVDTLSKEYKNILVAKATEVLSGERLLPSAQSEQKTYSATELGNMFGVTPQRIGIITNKHDLKTEEYGEWYRDKSKHSSKEVDSFRYFNSVISRLEEILSVDKSA